MGNSIELIDIVIIIGICQGIFLSLTLLRISDNNRSANIILSFLLMLATSMLIGRFVYFKFLSAWVFQWSLLVDSLVFLFGPMLFVYIRRLLFKANVPYRLSLWHYVPFFMMVTIALYYALLYSPKEYYQLFVEGNLMQLFNVLSIIMIAFNFIYLIKSFLLLKTYKANKKDTFSFDQTPLTYLYYFLLAFAACLFAWFISFVNSTFFGSYFKYVNYESVWVAIPVFIYVIGYFSLKQPELFRIPLEAKKIDKRDRLTESESKILSEKLNSLMINERLFLEGNLTLKEVAETLNTSTNNISWLLNTVYKITFYDFINGFRIKEFVAKVENKEHLQHTILALSMDVGFNSKSTFNKAFKLAMKETPSNFIKNYRAA